MIARLSSMLALSAVAVATWSADRSPDPIAQSPRDRHFLLSEECGLCHIAAPGATAMKDADDNDLSPYYTWQATMMANSFRDPYFRAQIQKETEAAGEAVQELCLRCHTPMVHHEARLNGDPAPRLAHAVEELEADDGVSCTVCHTIRPDGLGERSSFSGRPSFAADGFVYGPYEDVLVQPMQSLVRRTPKHGAHLSTSALCATCHTLITEHHGTPFPEQTPYLEWRNSEFNDEREGAEPGKTRTCQQCHMPEREPTRIARNPMGFDFRDAKVRKPYRTHAFVGGNAFMLDMLREHGEDLYVEAEPEQLLAMAAATRKQLAETTATVAITRPRRNEGELEFDVRVTNETGHKFPTGYPARRAWLRIELLAAGEVVFASGAVDEDGRLVGIEDEFAIPHVRTVRSATDVVVYELVATDPEGRPTTYLTRMVGKQKDTRLLPRGYSPDGPHTDEIAPVGVDGDDDFVGGSDRVACRIPIPAGVDGPLEVRATLLYQTVPPAWVDALRPVEAEEAKRFVGYYDAAEKRPEVVAEAKRSE